MSLQERVNGAPVAPIDAIEAAAADEPEHVRSLQDRINESASAQPHGAVDPYAELKARIHRACIGRIGPELLQSSADGDVRDQVLRVVGSELQNDATPLTRAERAQLAEAISDDILGLGPLEPLLADPSVTEIMVNGFDRIYIECRGKILQTDAAFFDRDHLLRIIDRIVSRVGRRVDDASPMVDARLPDGSRVNAIVEPLALDGPALTIRKFARDLFSIDELVLGGTLDGRAADFLSICVAGKLNVLISGGTGVGKTTLLNALSTYIPEDERIITIEDAAELQLQQEHVLRLESRPPNIEGQGEIRIRDLVRNALRMRPDRIIVGEVRGPETIDMLQAMNTGHQGSLTTIHANSPRDALARLETLVLTAGVDLPLRAIREQIASAFDLVVQVVRLVDGTRRISHITEVQRMESDLITLQDVFVARPPHDDEAGGTLSLLAPLEPTGLIPQFIPKLSANGCTLPIDVFGAPAGGGPVELRTARGSR